MTDGSQAHKTLFCQTFIDTHRAFEPAQLPWPVLDEGSIDRLRSIPFWSVALAAERNAGYMVSAYAAKVDDPLIKRALAVQGVEEMRHANLLAEMLKRYAIEVPERTVPQPPAVKRRFIDFGYEECIDSFFGFGIFGLAKQIQLFVPELTDIFELVLLEEARHVTFFVNWVAYERISNRRGWRPLQGAATVLGYARALKQIATTFTPRGEERKKMQGVGFGAEGAFALFEDVTWRSFLTSCLRGHEQYMSAMPAALIKPSLLPNAARFALTIIPSWRKPASRATAA